MILKDQPTNLPKNVLVAVSDVSDGNMKHMPGAKPELVKDNRQNFLNKVGVNWQQTSLVYVNYQRDDFCRYAQVTPQEQGTSLEVEVNPQVTDALITDQPNQALFLPIADCCPLVLTDHSGRYLMLSHLGRHSAEQDGTRRSVEFFCRAYNLTAADLQAWLGPAAGRENYPLHKLGNQSLHQVIYKQLIEAGIDSDKIEISQVDTTTDKNYFSASQFNKDQSAQDGRFAVVAALKKAK